MKTTMKKIYNENKLLRIALSDAIKSPMGVVPDSALGFYCGRTGEVTKTIADKY